ncbi:coronatine-insensitive protein 1-like [Rutidosis leptorrhynchoides]|uniref:coronatine-insensitive protein 1-like n=1 Tax=Rutidosis leptorrhynchoides TaxID=125765 RepID=UPI003A995A61
MEPDSIDRVFDYVIPYIHTTDDRNSVSLVCRKWFHFDCLTRKHVTIHLCYATSPHRLSRRFPFLKSLTLKGKPGKAIPRASAFQWVPHDWGGYVSSWIEVISNTNSFRCLKSIRFRRMIVTDSDLELLVRMRGKDIRVLDINGFSTDGLLKVSTNCCNLRTLCLQKSEIVDKDGEWLHELASRNTCMESLNFYETGIDKCDTKDLVLLTKNCSDTLTSLKVTDCDLSDLMDVFRYAVKLEEYGGAPYTTSTGIVLKIPLKLRSITITYRRNHIPILIDFPQQLTELNLTCVSFNDNDYDGFLAYKCPSLEVLYAKDTIGDSGLQDLSQSCKKLRRVKIMRGSSEEGVVSQLGLIALARGCVKIECLHAYIKDITNEALECIGSNLKNLYDFRITSVATRQMMTDLPLDNGVQALLRGCTKLEKLGIYIHNPVPLTDVGLSSIGIFGKNLRSLMLGFLMKPNDGLLQLSVGCPKLQKFEVRGFGFNEQAISMLAWKLSSLRYMWIQSYRAGYTICETKMDFIESKGNIFGGDGNIRNLIRPNWHMELIRPEVHVDVDSFQPFSLLAYYSLIGQRMDLPKRVIPLHSPLDDHDSDDDD